jgi:HAD superfamily hydrolase (TIGR01490 family)
MSVLAIFDMDETLIACDSSTLWLAYLVEKGLAPAEMLETEKAMMQSYHRGELSMQIYMDYTLRPLAGMTVLEVDALAEDYVARIVPHMVYSQALALLQWHRQQRHTLLVISATAEFIVRKVAADLGVLDVIAIELEQHNDRYTGATQGDLSFREGKVQRLGAWLKANNHTLWGSFGYSDSVNDLPLLEAVDNPHVVNPSPHFQQLIQPRQWPQLNWQLMACA